MSSTGAIKDESEDNGNLSDGGVESNQELESVEGQDQVIEMYMNEEASELKKEIEELEHLLQDEEKCRAAIAKLNPNNNRSHERILEISNRVMNTSRRAGSLCLNEHKGREGQIHNQNMNRITHFRRVYRHLKFGQVVISSQDLKANHSIQQHVDIVTQNQKYNKLVKLLDDIMDGSRTLIFMDMKKGCDQITRQLRMDGWPAYQSMEIKVKQKEIRIGRTGRVRAKGTAYTFFTATNARFAKELIAILQEAGQKVNPDLAAIGRGAPPPPSGSFGQDKLDKELKFTAYSMWRWTILRQLVMLMIAKAEPQHSTLMELVRVLALSFSNDGKCVKVFVQGSMGEGALAGMPLQLACRNKKDFGVHGLGSQIGMAFWIPFKGVSRLSLEQWLQEMSSKEEETRLQL
ncbi:unnamed protein product [Lactuca saligna]|uniref:Uncharacterized protein n=1 Tax=Lactuca saligna TaxID=75948 RepID=A0AA35ZPY9_LACSI|nr:unnamed protein product [Lactuca saligna]